MKNKILYAIFNNTCYRYVNSEGWMICKEEEELYSSYEEADSTMFFHLDHIFGLINVVICADDTGCLVTALGCKHLFEQKVDIWLNNLCYINVNKIHNHLGETLCRAPSACHALTEQNTLQNLNILIKLTMYGTQVVLGIYEAKKPEERISFSKNFNSSMMPPYQKYVYIK